MKVAIIILLGISTSCAGQHHSDRVKASGSGLPNIVFILADDMGYGDVQCYNAASKIATPNIDHLAAEGIKFTDAHAPGSWCVPSRYGLITGQYPLRKSMNIKKGGLIAKGQTTIASLLQRNGYHTAMIGKWHLGFDGISDWDKVDYNQPFKGGPLDHGFDYFFGMHASLDIPPYFYIENNRAVEAPTGPIADHQSVHATTTISGKFWRAGKIAPGFKHEEVLPAFTRKAVSVMETHVIQKKRQPFFLYLSLTAPHTPWMAQAPFAGKSAVGEYGDFTMQVDHTIGQVLKTLEKLALKENTLVIFTSDNGPVWFKEDILKFNHRSTAKFRGMKLDAYEGGHRVPFIVRWPGKIKPGTSSSTLLCFTDMLATFAEVVGDTLSAETRRDSYNLLPALINNGKSQRKGLIVEGHTVRDGDWKLIFGSGTGVLQRQWGLVKTGPVKGELYNLKQDPGETNNLYSMHPEKVAVLTRQMEQYKAESTAPKLSQAVK
ncbi:MAG: arylsulfatase [Chitinophagaceae bacterium]